MLQNVFTTRAARKPGALNVHINLWAKRNTIIGKRPPLEKAIRRKMQEEKYPVEFTKTVEEP
jgi:hypothetical protein